MGTLSEPRSFFPVERGTVDLLAKACAHAEIKAIAVKITVITSAIFAVDVFKLKKKKKKKKKKHEQMEGLVVFSCQEV